MIFAVTQKFQDFLRVFFFFRENHSHDKLCYTFLTTVCFILRLLVKTQSEICFLSLISALSLSLPLFVFLAFVLHSHSWVLLTSQRASLKSPDNPRKKRNNICLSAFEKQKTKKKQKQNRDRRRTKTSLKMWS